MPQDALIEAIKPAMKEESSMEYGQDRMVILYPGEVPSLARPGQSFPVTLRVRIKAMDDRGNIYAKIEGQEGGGFPAPTRVAPMD